MSTQPTTTSNFSGKAAGFYISAALKEVKSLDYLTSKTLSLKATFKEWLVQT